MIDLINKLKSLYTMDTDENIAVRTPILVGIFLNYLTTLFLQNLNKICIWESIIFTILMGIYSIVYLFTNILFKDKHWIYFGIQGIIITIASFIMPKGYIAILLGLIAALIFQSIGIYYNTLKVTFTFLFFYALFCSITATIGGVHDLIRAIPILFLLIIATVAFSTVYFRQSREHIRTQKILRELEFAYEKVEELTLTNERQRMARDLHDTLAQGLAGIIMQLEAVDANLNNNNIKRSQEIVSKAMGYARKTLSDSRLAIDDLRFKEDSEIDFVNSVENEIAHFKVISNCSVSLDIKVESKIALKIFEHILYIVRECLNNIAKHSKAKTATVEIIENDNEININILDDGIGFDVKLLDQLYGHYGLLGITERVKAIDGEIKIKSKRKSGTNINIRIPIEKGVFNENE